MGSIHEVIEAFRKAPSNSERGTKFEELMVRYFELDPVLSQQYESVWRWMDWPGRQGKPDTGIDLVARERDTGEYSAIQCKFYEPTHTLRKEDIDSFFTASGKQPFSNRIIISTTDRWGKNAEDALEGQTIPVQRIGMAEIAEAPIAWDIAWPDETPTVSLAPAVKHEPRKHQHEAIDAVFRGFDTGHDRGKLIMACGTGKTFTALKIAERTAAENGGKATILFAVPSISLLSQTLREWSGQTQLDLRAFAVCSDKKVSRSAEDITAVDVAIPVTTDAAQLAAEMAHRKRAAGLTVVFTTYQSLPAVAEAQKLGVDPFDLVIADEAHRTTGVTLLDADESHFVRIHDADYLHATRRLYMTATPRIYDEKVKAKADDASAEVTSMDDEDVYGPEFHRLSFGHAVERGLLSDYKVLVLTVDQEMIADTVQQGMSSGFGELRLDDASKIVGCWNGLAKRAGTTPTGTGFTPGEAPMRRAVAFAKDIKASKQVADVFPAVVDGYRTLLTDAREEGRGVEETNLDLSCEVRHVDGTFNALERGRELAWLKAPSAEDECRILTNARCLSEGVDVPALDAVLFLHPRNSVVDVVQSVGRVMRRADGKDYGYIILPVAVPAGVEPSKALNDNQRFKTVWQVLNALRAHDDRFNAFVNSISLNSTAAAEKGQGSGTLLGGHIGPVSTPRPGPGETESLDESGDPYATDPAQADRELAKQMALFSLSEWQEAIYARIVDKVGTRTYWEDWAKDVADIASALISRIRAILGDADATVSDGFHKFVTGLRDNLNDSITDDDAISMLAQHLITKPVFDALFAGHAFADSNPVSVTMQKMVDTLGGVGLEAETTKLEGFYASVRTRASEVTTAAGTQQVIAELYEKFFKLGFAKQADALGIVYTPTEIVDFILHAADHASRDAFGRGLTDDGVHILDPFTGTGTFMTRLLQSGIINPADLARKYANELHANEIMLLAYYIAAVNIETTYHALTETDEYEPFEGIVLADTFQITEDGDSFDEVIFPQNNERITRQLAMPINVIVGNPPYSVGQNSANDLNANVTYPTLDKRITDTYAARSTAQLKNSLYDSYLRAFRWATDRIGDTGIVAFVSNGGWISGNTAAGVRLALAEEYSRVYVYNLRGNARTAGELRKKEKGNVFGSGGRTTIAIWIGVKDPTHTGGLELLYRDIGDYLSRDEKLATVAGGRLDTIDWETITPNEYGDWDDQRDAEFSTWPAIGNKDVRSGAVTVFAKHSRGLATSRDAWCYNFSMPKLRANVSRTAEFYNAEADRLAPLRAPASEVNNLVTVDSTKFSWDRVNKKQVLQGKRIEIDPDGWRIGSYRPFNKRHVYFDPRQQLNNCTYQLPSMFPTPHHRNLGIVLTGPASHFEFAPYITDLLPNLHVLDTAQYFPRWTYEKVEPSEGALDFGTGAGEADEWGYRRVDNITDAIRTLYIDTLGGTVTKDDIFYYVYGLLHDPAYRYTYATDLRKMLPHIPTPDSRERFDRLATAGRQLADLQVGYESVDPYPLDVELKANAGPDDRETWRVTKLGWGKKKDPGTDKNVDDRTTIVYNKKVTIAGIPQDAERYMLGPRSALAWIIDRYQVKTDKASGIVNDPNDWCDEHDDPHYIVDLIAKVTTVAVETMKIVDRLSASG
ncbi:DEAD/DEAH box helicase [Gordonia liuliyuniae]|uniref:DEAD/DEAH box helicase n=1 Tax=Gordonia liuliyuniae TaxID=2911517 RepID=A0ABS9IT59_9ACTN|nr:DEAD/DEAH box helicase [Gordonia liuliyuniae]MCF8588744.1 DEAD/DEAH box helicase [Gordonia liuliyuniae]